MILLKKDRRSDFKNLITLLFVCEYSRVLYNVAIIYVLNYKCDE